MKLYSAHKAPGPRRILLALAEKGISDVEIINIDLAAGDNLTREFQQLNPLKKVPVLQLDNGTCIAEGGAIYRYLEEICPEPPLLGTTPEEKAITEMWDRRVELAFLLPVGQCFQHSSGFFKDRMTPVAAWGEECGRQAAAFLPLLEEQLQQHTYVAGEHFSVADITTLSALEFARIIKLRAGDEFPAIQRWYKLMQQRDSYGA